MKEGSEGPCTEDDGAEEGRKKERKEIKEAPGKRGEGTRDAWGVGKEELYMLYVCI